MINDGLNSRSVKFLGLVASLNLFITLSPLLMLILLINNKTTHFNYLDLIKSLFFWILERRFGSCSILQISLRTGNFYYLTRSRQPLVSTAAVAQQGKWGEGKREREKKGKKGEEGKGAARGAAAAVLSLLGMYHTRMREK